MDEIPYINGRLYSWAQISLGIDGVPVNGIRAIRYSDTENKENIYGGGRYAVGYGDGQITCEAAITLLMDEIVPLQNASPTGRLQDLAPFDITVCYMHPVSSKVVTDVITDCQFVKNDRDWQNGDTFEEVELTLLTPYIKWGKTA